MLLRAVTDDDIEVFYEHQTDLGAAAMVGMPSRDREAYFAHWERIRADPTVATRAIVVDGEVAGNALSFIRNGRREVGYWLGREFWGRGIASAALREFLDELDERPLYGAVAPHNQASMRVLEKCGFVRVGEDDGLVLFELRS